MKTRHRSMAVGVGLVAIGLAVSTTWAKGDAEDGIGIFTAVQGQVTVAHPKVATIVPVKLQDAVLFKDIIETQNESRTKALFEDDSLLTVGENSRIEITEHIYDPNQNKRSMVVKLVQGRLRALVSKIFTGSGSKFEIHTPTAVAAARGTYFVVWFENGTSGVVNIGNSGIVDFTSEGKRVSVKPGEYSFAALGEAPVQAAVLDGGQVAGQIQRAEQAAKKIANTAGKAAEKIEKTEQQAEKKIANFDENVPQKATELIAKTAENAVEKITRTAENATQKIDRTAEKLVSGTSPILASIRNAVEGTELTEVPAGTAIRAMPAIPAIPATRATPGGQGMRAIPATPANPATPAIPAVPAVISGAANAHPSHPLGGPPGLAGGGPPGGPPCGAPPCGGPPGGAPPGGPPPGVMPPPPPPGGGPPGSLTGGLVGERR